MAYLYNFLVHIHIRVRNMVKEHYMVIIAPDKIEAENTAVRLAKMLPSTAQILSVEEV